MKIMNNQGSLFQKLEDIINQRYSFYIYRFQ